jgi:predicted regulator of amino acid metabolism with ACT domain
LFSKNKLCNFVEKLKAMEIRIETSHPHIAQRIAEFAEQLGAIVKMPKKNKAKAIEMDETELIMSSETRRNQVLRAIAKVEKGDTLVEVNLEDLKKQFGID